jgi:hypothetical protein
MGTSGIAKVFLISVQQNWIYQFLSCTTPDLDFIRKSAQCTRLIRRNATGNILVQDQFDMIDTLTRNSQKFKSSHLHAQIIFGGFIPNSRFNRSIKIK